MLRGITAYLKQSGVDRHRPSESHPGQGFLGHMIGWGGAPTAGGVAADSNSVLPESSWPVGGKVPKKLEESGVTASN